MIQLIFQSINVRKNKFALLVIEFVVGFVALIYGLSNLESLYRYKNSIENEISLDTIHLNMKQNDTHEITSDELAKYNTIINRIKDDQEVEYCGLFQNIFVYKNEIPVEEDEEKIYILNKDMLQIMNLKIEEGNMESVINYNREEDVIPILVSAKLSEQFQLHKVVTMYLYDKNEMMKRTFEVVGILSNDMCFFYGGQSTASDLMCTNKEFIIAPYFMDFNSQMPYKNNMFLSVQKNTNKVLSKVKEIFLESGITVSDCTIRDEISEYYHRQKPIIIYTIIFSVILLSLSIIGCIGTILSSILYRKKEFGVYFSLGFTKKNLCQFICGEIGILLLMSLGIAIIIDMIVFHTLLADVGMTVSFGVIMYSNIIMVLCAFLCLLLPVRKMSKINPIDLLNERNR